MNALAPSHRGSCGLLAAAAFSCALVAAGCDKAKEETVPAAATVIMPGTPAPSDAVAASSPSPMLAASSPGALPTAADADANLRNNAAAPSGGTVSVLPGPATAPAPTTIVVVNPPNGGGTAPASTGPGASVLPPALTASQSGPGSIGPNPSANPGSDQPPSFAPGTPPPAPQR